jgi:hypothetical protein
MKKITGIAVLCVGLLAFGAPAFAQASLSAFPKGTTTMTYSMTSTDMGQPQKLELVVTAHGDGTYTLNMSINATGTSDQLSGFGFLFGGGSLAAGTGQDISYSSLQALIAQRSRLEAGQEYLLPGGGKFTDIKGVTIAGVWCLQGSFVDPNNPDTRTTLAFALSHPVYIFPEVKVEKKENGKWVETFALELTGYNITAPKD